MKEENSRMLKMALKLQSPQINFYWNTAMLIHLPVINNVDYFQQIIWPAKSKILSEPS